MLLGLREMVGLVAAVVALVAALLLPFAARAECPTYTVSHGLSGTFDRVDFLLPAAQVQKVSLAPGYSVNLNFVPNGDCSVRWVSLMAAAQLGVGQSATSSAPAFTFTPLAGVGVYNGLVRVLIGYDFLNLRPGDLSGLFTGRFVPGNLALFVGSGLNFDLAELLPMGAMGAALAPRPEPTGWVRP